MRGNTFLGELINFTKTRHQNHADSYTCIQMSRATSVSKPCPYYNYLLGRSVEWIFFWTLLKAHQEPISRPTRRTRWRCLHHAPPKKDNACVQGGSGGKFLRRLSVSRGQDCKMAFLSFALNS